MQKSEFNFSPCLMLREAFVQPGVDSVVRDQFVVSSVFDDSPMVEHDDLIGVANGTEAMSNDERRAAMEQYFQRVLQSRFGGTVDATRRFVQN